MCFVLLKLYHHHLELFEQMRQFDAFRFLVLVKPCFASLFEFSKQEENCASMKSLEEVNHFKPVS